jgi:hypothetical protein
VTGPETVADPRGWLSLLRRRGTKARRYGTDVIVMRSDYERMLRVVAAALDVDDAWRHDLIHPHNGDGTRALTVNRSALTGPGPT